MGVQEHIMSITYNMNADSVNMQHGVNTSPLGHAEGFNSNNVSALNIYSKHM